MVKTLTPINWKLKMVTHYHRGQTDINCSLFVAKEPPLVIILSLHRDGFWLSTVLLPVERPFKISLTPINPSNQLPGLLLPFLKSATAKRNDGMTIWRLGGGLLWATVSSLDRFNVGG